MNAPLVRPAALALLSAPLAAGDVLVVDDDGGPGVDFTAIQPAVDAAADGDVVLVRSGSYDGFSMVGKGVALVADNDASVIVAGMARVADVPSGSVAVVRGLSTSEPERHGLFVDSCEGSVRIEECDFVGEASPSEYQEQMSFFGALVLESDDVLLARSSFAGGSGSNVGFFGAPYPGSPGVHVARSTVVLVDCELSGGHGKDAPHDEWYDGSAGGHGVLVWSSSVWISGCRSEGGYGGSGDYDYDPLFGTKLCGNGGDGGDGVYVQSYTTLIPGYGNEQAPSRVVVRDFYHLPGNPGATMCALPGELGQTIDFDTLQPHEIEELPGAARSTYANSPARGGTLARFYAEGEPGDAFLLLVGPALGPLDVPGLVLPLTVGPGLVAEPLGVISAEGTLLATFPLPEYPVGFGGETLLLQGALVPSGGGGELAPHGTVTLLEPGF